MNAARLRAYLMLLVVAVIWGVATPIIKYTFEGFPTEIFLVYRFFISTVVGILIFAVSGLHLPKDMWLFLTMLLYGFLNSVVSLSLLFFGMENTTVIEAGLINLAAPLIVSTAGVYFLHEHITKREKFGMGIAILGTMLTIAGPLITNGHSSIKFSGNILIFGYVLSSVITTIIAKNMLKKGVHPMTMVNISFIIGFISFLILNLYKMPLVDLIAQISSVPIKYHYGVFYMAILSGTLAFYLGNKAQKTIEIGEQSLFSYLNPVFALPLAVIWLGEKVTSMHIIGGIIIIIGVAIAEIKKKRYNSKVI